MAATIGTRLWHQIKNELGTDLTNYFWSDSTTVLSWIKLAEEWAPFVWNRIEEIRRLTPVDAWRHVPGDINPADLPSRGCSPRHLMESRWWEGPQWLYSDIQYWPTEDTRLDEDTEVEVYKEKKKGVTSAFVNNEVNAWYAQYFSKYNNIVRLLSWMHRFSRNCRNPLDRQKGELSTEELHEGERSLLKVYKQNPFMEKMIRKYR